MISGDAEPTLETISQPPSPFSSLPDEITAIILARVSRWNNPSLSLVSKRFHSLLSTMEIHKTRSQIGSKETCFYVCLSFHNSPNPSWFSLWTKPNQTLTKQNVKPTRFKPDSSGNSVVLMPFSSSHSHPTTNDSTVTVGSEIYIIGGPWEEEPSSSVRILDCQSHTWRDAPSMTVARENPCAVYLDGKIYVMGGCDIDDYSTNWFEVFDIKTQSWTASPGPGADDDVLGNLLRENYYFHIVNAFEGEVCLAVGEKEYTCELKEGTWKLAREQPSNHPFDSIAAWCEIGNVIYCCTLSRDLLWSESDSKTKSRKWREIKGLGKLHETAHRAGLRTGNVFDMADYDGKLLVMWDVCDTKPKNKIRYAKISLESRCKGQEVWGKVECVDVFTFPGQVYNDFFCVSSSV